MDDREIRLRLIEAAAKLPGMATSDVGGAGEAAKNVADSWYAWVAYTGSVPARPVLGVPKKA
jgi:hypothetical protein